MIHRTHVRRRKTPAIPNGHPTGKPFITRPGADGLRRIERHIGGRIEWLNCDNEWTGDLNDAASFTQTEAQRTRISLHGGHNEAVCQQPLL